MTIDHLGVVFNTLHNYRVAGSEFAGYMTDAYWQMRVIGRLAFPIFCFLIAEGCAHTKSIKKYVGRLAIFALISQIPYQIFWDMRTGIDSVVSNLIRYERGNVLVTLTLGVVAVFFYQKIYESKKVKTLYIAGIIAAFIAVILLKGEYDLCGLLIIMLVYIFREKENDSLDNKVLGNRYIQVLCCALVSFAYYVLILHAPLLEVLGATLSALPLLLYNRQPGNRKWKWAFYIFYPAHMVALFFVMYFVMV
jgi:hypothetical protein